MYYVTILILVPNISGLSLNKICRLVSALQLSSVNQWWQRPLLKMVLVGLLLINIPMSAYFCLIHQRGGYAVMDHLRNEHVILLMVTVYND